MAENPQAPQKNPLAKPPLPKVRPEGAARRWTRATVVAILTGLATRGLVKFTVDPVFGRMVQYRRADAELVMSRFSLEMGNVRGDEMREYMQEQLKSPNPRPMREFNLSHEGERKTTEIQKQYDAVVGKLMVDVNSINADRRKAHQVGWVAVPMAGFVALLISAGKKRMLPPRERGVFKTAGILTKQGYRNWNEKRKRGSPFQRRGKR